MIEPPEALVAPLTKRTFSVFCDCMAEETDTEAVITRVSAVIKEELDKFKWPYKDEEIRMLAITLGIKFADAMQDYDPEGAANDDPHPLY